MPSKWYAADDLVVGFDRRRGQRHRPFIDDSCIHQMDYPLDGMLPHDLETIFGCIHMKRMGQATDLKIMEKLQSVHVMFFQATYLDYLFFNVDGTRLWRAAHGYPNHGGLFTF
jgi:hypothetical protein